MNDFYTDLADELRALAADVESLAGHGLPDAPVLVDILPFGGKPVDGDRVAAIDRVGVALTGKPGVTSQMSSGTWQHIARGIRGAIRLSVFNEVPDPTERERDNELHRLRAEVARLSAGGAR